MATPDRTAAMHEIAAKITARNDELGRLLTEEEGKPLPEDDEELWWVAETFRYYAELSRHDRCLVLPPGDPDQLNFTIKEPYGVVANIAPWNSTWYTYKPCCRSILVGLSHQFG